MRFASKISSYKKPLITIVAVVAENPEEHDALEVACQRLIHDRCVISYTTCPESATATKFRITFKGSTKNHEEHLRAKYGWLAKVIF